MKQVRSAAGSDIGEVVALLDAGATRFGLTHSVKLIESLSQPPCGPPAAD